MKRDDDLERLGRAHGFTPDELRANLRGDVHPAQLARGRRKERAALLAHAALGLLALGGGLGGAWVYRDALGPAPSDVDLKLVYVIAAAALLLALAFGFGARNTLVRRRRRRAAFAAGRIDVLEGPLDKTAVHGNGGGYYFRVRGRSFQTSKALWELLTQGAAYRLHCVDDVLLSLAPAVGDPVEHAGYSHEVERFERTRRIEPSRLVR